MRHVSRRYVASAQADALGTYGLENDIGFSGELLQIHDIVK